MTSPPWERGALSATTAHTTVLLRIGGPVATVTLNRPDVRNALNPVMVGELARVFRHLAERDDVTAIVLEGAGKAFSAGADVDWMRESIEYTREQNVADAARMADMFDAIDTVPQPTVARVHGAAVGGGVGLIAACDVVVADEATVFGFTEARLGIVPAIISSLVIPKIGPSWARALYLTGRRFGADLAREIGLVHVVAPAHQVDSSVRQQLSDIQACGPKATRAAKRLIREVGERDPSELRDYSSTLIAELRASEEGQEGLRAFLEKRAPRWHG